MGCVYRAEHVSLRRPVALKLLHEDVEALEGIATRFEREAFAIDRVNHPNCVNVSDFGRLDDGSLFMALELLDGTPLFDLLNGEPKLPWRRALRIARHVLRALEHAHARGIVHRDIKPENVVLVKEGDDSDFAKILDFGIAKLSEDALHEVGSPGTTQLGVVIGTPTYMAPEQAFGQTVDGRADLYAVSIMLYEMLSGTPPFDDPDSAAILRMHMTRAVPPLSGVDVPREVEMLVRRGLEKDRDDRIASAEAYIAEIDALLSDGAVLHEDGSESAAGKADDMSPAEQLDTRWMLPFLGSKRLPFSVAMAVVVMSGVVILGAISGQETKTGPTQSRTSPLARKAAAMLEAGEPQDAINAIKTLESSESALAGDSGAKLVLGHAYASAGEFEEAARAYEHAVSLRSPIARDPQLQSNFARMLERRDARSIGATMDLAATMLRESNDTQAAEGLAWIASAHPLPWARRRAADIATALGLEDDIDRVSAAILDLQQGETCPQRKKAVAKLRALEDPRAIPALRQAKNRTKKVGLLDREVNENQCLQKDAARAIAKLSKRQSG